MKDLMVAVAGLFGRRFTKRQKNAFLRYMGNRAAELDCKAVVDGSGQGMGGGCRNLYLGNIKRASVILTAPYDTPSRLLWPGMGYYPADPARNLIRESVAMALNLILAALLVGAYYLLVMRRLLPLGGFAPWWSMVGMLAVAATAFKLIFGFANRRNYSRNSASIVTALEYQKQQGRDVAVALLDRSCCGYEGYRQLAQYLGGMAQSKRVLMLDCVASGSELHLHCGEMLAGCLAGLESDVQVHPLETDRLKRTPMELFPKGVLITGGTLQDGETVIHGTRCGRDSEINLEKMNRVLVVLGNLMEKLA